MSRPLSLAVLFVAGFAATACVEPQKPFHFLVTKHSDDAVDVVARTLAANGHQPANIDRRTGIVSTKWEETGFNYGFVQGKPAVLVKRFTVTIGATAAGDDVTVRMDAKHCQQGGYTIGDVDVTGPCEVIDGVVGPQQEEVNQLGATVAQALGQPR